MKYVVIHLSQALPFEDLILFLNKSNVNRSWSIPNYAQDHRILDLEGSVAIMSNVKEVFGTGQGSFI